MSAPPKKTETKSVAPARPALPHESARPTPKIMQAKPAPTPPAAARKTEARLPAAPPVYRPLQSPRVLQPSKISRPAVSHTPAPAYTHARSANVPQKVFTAAAQPPQPARNAHAPRASAAKTSNPQPEVLQRNARRQVCGVVQRSAVQAHARNRVVQLSPQKLNKSKHLRLERKVFEPISRTTYSKTAAQYYGETVSPWLIKMSSEGGIVGAAALEVLEKIRRGRIRENDWKRLEWYIDWVNRAVDAHGNKPVEKKQDDKTHILGVAMSKQEKIGIKYANYDEYVAKKRRQQGRTRHIGAKAVETMILNATGGASEVSAKLFLNAKAEIVTRIKAKPKEKLKYEDTFSIPGGKHNHEIDKSKDDGEVVVLAKALETLENDLKDINSAHQHKLALVGPYGACDGCKDRIRAFKRAWDKARTEANTTGSLVITYFYRNEAAPGPDRKDSQYGWDQARKGNTMSDTTFYYWSTVVN